MKPLFDKILIEPEKTEAITSTGIYLTQGEKKLEQAIVLDVGEEVKTVTAGQKIVFKNYNIDTIEIDKVEYSFISESEVLAIYDTSS
jgi:co-chaperonin GroES (HSP10)